MYGFVTHTWNPINGKCSHGCSYCYMLVYKQKSLHLSEKSLKDDLGSGNFIFVGSSTDMFADDVPKEWIKKVLSCCGNCRNTYLFQTKNPARFEDFVSEFQEICVTGDVIIGTTIETNREIPFSKAPSTMQRIQALARFPDWRRMITIEPILEFDLDNLVDMIKEIKPEWVNIGADSKGHNLPEPSKEKIEALISALQKFTEVKIKNNLYRIIQK